MSRIDVYRMIQRRARNAGLNIDLCCHSFRATGITAYLNNGGTLENAQKLPHTKARVRLNSTTAPTIKLNWKKSKCIII